MVKKKYSLYTILNKSLKYKDKHNLSDKEFKIFKKKYVKLLNISNNSKNYTILKQINQNQYMTNKINIKDEDLPISKQILDLYQYSKLNWQQVVLQSITYNEDYIKQQNNIKDNLLKQRDELNKLIQTFCNYIR